MLDCVSSTKLMMMRRRILYDVWFMVVDAVSEERRRVMWN